MNWFHSKEIQELVIQELDFQELNYCVIIITFQELYFVNRYKNTQYSRIKHPRTHNSSRITRKKSLGCIMPDFKTVTGSDIFSCVGVGDIVPETVYYE